MLIHDEPSIGAVVNLAARLLRRLANERLAALEISSGVLPVLTALIETDGQTQKALAERARIEQPTMAATLVRMERDGLVERAADPADKRTARFTLSPAARKRVPEIQAAIRALGREATADLSAAEEAALRSALAKISKRIDAILQTC